MFVVTQPHPYEQDMAQGEFLIGVQMVWVQSFLSLKLIALPRIKNAVSPIYP